MNRMSHGSFKLGRKPHGGKNTWLQSIESRVLMALKKAGVQSVFIIIGRSV